MHKYKRMGIWFSMLAAFLTGILFMNLAGDTYLGKSMVSLQKIMYSGREEMTGKSGYLYYLLFYTILIISCPEERHSRFHRFLP